MAGIRGGANREGRDGKEGKTRSGGNGKEGMW